MNNNKEVDPENLGGLGDMLPADVLEKLNQLLEMLHQTEGDKKGSTARGYPDKYWSLTPNPSPKGEGDFKGEGSRSLCNCFTLSPS